MTQTCVVHLVRNSFRYASRKGWDAIAKALPPVYTAVSEATALDAFAQFPRRPREHNAASGRHES